MKYRNSRPVKLTPRFKRAEASLCATFAGDSTKRKRYLLANELRWGTKATQSFAVAAKGQSLCAVPGDSQLSYRKRTPVLRCRTNAAYSNGGGCCRQTSIEHVTHEG